MIDKFLLSLTLGCFALANIPFWLWKGYIITQRHWVDVLISLFVILFGLGIVFGFAWGSRWIIKTTSNFWTRGGLFLMMLFGGAYAALMAALGMNFVGQ